MYTEKFTSPTSYEFFFFISPAPKPLFKGVDCVTQKVRLTALQKQKIEARSSDENWGSAIDLGFFNITQFVLNVQFQGTLAILLYFVKQ